MSSHRITYQPRPNTTPETELNALSACYAFILKKYQDRKKGRPTTSGPDDAKERIKDDSCADKAIIPE